MSLLLIALLQLFLLFRNVISTCSTTSNVEFTFYGFPDGSSDTTSFGCLGTQQVADGTAGGDGSYAHPETFATALNNPNFVPCEIIYIPLFQKYFQYMDHCEECMQLYPNTIRIDLWIGTDVNGGQNQIACEDAFGLKTGQTIVRDPPSTLRVSADQLWDNDSGTCNDASAVFPNYSTSEADMCAGSSTSSTGNSSPPPPPSPPPSSPPSTTSSSTAPTSTPATPSSTDSSSNPPNEKKIDTVAKFANVKADVAPPPPPQTTLTTIVSPPSAFASKSSDDCGVTAEWPTPWLGHCVGAPCHEFNDCSGELICQGWPNPVCTKPSGGR